MKEHIQRNKKRERKATRKTSIAERERGRKVGGIKADDEIEEQT